MRNRTIRNPAHWPLKEYMGKAPAFQLYASDFYMDTAGWTVAQVGVYARLLMYEWVNGPIPSDMASLSRIAGISDPRTMYKIWLGTVGKKFISNGGNLLYNKRLEEEREKQDKRREIQTKKGISGAKKRWEGHIAPAIAQAQPNDSSSSSSSIIKEKKYIKKRNVLIPDEEWIKNLKSNPAFKEISIDRELAKMDAWLSTKPQKKKTRRFIVNWLNRVENPITSPSDTISYFKNDVGSWQCRACGKSYSQFDNLKMHLREHG